METLGSVLTLEGGPGDGVPGDGGPGEGVPGDGCPYLVAGVCVTW